jgi:predicted metal-binding membrane protein
MRPARITVSMRRSRGAVRSPSAVAVLGRRDHFLVVSCIILITALAWAYLIQLDHRMSSAVDRDPMMRMGMAMATAWSARDLFFTFAMWAVMMVGMMTPSAAPMLLLFAAGHARRAKRGVPLVVSAFGLGYIAVWVGFSICAATAQWVLHNAALLTPAMAASSAQLGGAILVGAGAYQLTPLKGSCLVRCQSPLGFLMSNWRDGAGGAFRMGLGHGIHCVGCCWAMMLVLLVVGVMNLVWVGVLTGFILLEKLGSKGFGLARVGGVTLIVWGVVLLSRAII